MDLKGTTSNLHQRKSLSVVEHRNIEDISLEAKPKQSAGLFL